MGTLCTDSGNVMWCRLYGRWCGESAAAAAKSPQLCPTLCDPRDGSPPGSPVPDSPGKNTGVGCHFLLQCMKVKSESEVAQSCPTLSNPMDCSLPGSSIHGICVRSCNPPSGYLPKRTERKAVLTHATTWRDPEDIMPSETSQPPKD